MFLYIVKSFRVTQIQTTCFHWFSKRWEDVMRKYIGELSLIITAMIWGSGFVASSVSLNSFTPYQILAIRFLIGTILLSLVYMKKLKEIRRTTIRKGIILGFFLYIAFVLQTVGLQYTTPSKNAFLTAVNVVIVPFIGFFLHKKRIDVREITGAVLAMIGVGFISLKLSLEMNIGDVLTLLCAVGFAFQIFYTSRFVKDESPVLLTLVQMATAAILGLIFVFFKGEITISASKEGWLAVLYLGVFSTTIAYLLQTYAQTFTPETKTAIILSTESVWGMVFSILLLKEVITFTMVIGAMLILLAILISETKGTLLKGKTINLE